MNLMKMVTCRFCTSLILLLWALLPCGCLADPAPKWEELEYESFIAHISGEVRLEDGSPVAEAEIIQILTKPVDNHDNDNEGNGDTNGDAGHSESDTASFAPIPVYGARALSDENGLYSLDIALKGPFAVPEWLDITFWAKSDPHGENYQRRIVEHDTQVTIDFVLKHSDDDQNHQPNDMPNDVMKSN